MFNRYAYLEQHYERKHPGKPCREKRQASIADLFKTGSKRPHQLPSDEEEPMEEEHNAEDPGPSTSTHQPLPHSSIQTIQSKPNEEQPSSSSAIKQPQNQDETLLSQIQKVLDQWSKSSHVQNPPQPTPLLPPSQSSEQAEEKENQVRDRIKVCRCLRDFEILLEDHFQVDRENDKLICLVCKKSDQEKSGTFTISDVEYDTLPTKSRKLRNLQIHLISHLGSKLHKKNTSEERLKRKL